MASGEGVATPSPPGLVARTGFCLPKLLLVVGKKKKEVFAKYTLLLSHSCMWALSGTACWFQAMLGGTHGCSLLAQGLGVAVRGWTPLLTWEFAPFPLPSSLLLTEVRV